MITRMLAGLLSLALLGALSWAVLSLPAPPASLTEASLAKLNASGVENPVTAVLLNYRAYDTLLEIGVLLLAIVGVWSLRRGEWPVTQVDDRPLLRSLLRFVLPLLVLVAGHLLWIGAFAPGGAFQGGALLGGALVLVMLGGLARQGLNRERLLRAGLVLGLLVFVLVGAFALRLTDGLLQYPPGQGGPWILAIEAAALLSIGLTLGLLYLGGRPVKDSGDAAQRRPSDHD
jgi:multisubunit Na+/H+ antiporter MnhB subunit